MSSPDRALLAYMNNIVGGPFATLTDSMLVDGKVFQRCRICRCNPVTTRGNFLWCEPCMDAFIDADDLHPVNLDDWIEKRRTVPRGYGEDRHYN
jgi:hypothetical protein